MFVIRSSCFILRSDFVRQNSTLMDFDKNSWCILSPIEQSIKRKIEAVGVPLKDWNISINYGIKTGCNEAFIIDGATKDALIAQDPKSAEIIRPILRGRDIKRYSYEFADKWLIATLPSRHYNIDDYPAVKHYLLSFGKEKLEQSGKKDIGGIKGNNARKKTNNKWFETQDTIAYWDDFSKQKIVYIEIMTDNVKEGYPFPCFAYDENGTIVLNTGYIMTSDTANLYYILGVLNSKFGRYLLKNYVSQLQRRQYRMLAQFITQLPIPALTKNVQSDIAYEVKQIIELNKISNVIEQNIDSRIYSEIGLSKNEMEYITNYE